MAAPVKAAGGGKKPAAAPFGQTDIPGVHYAEHRMAIVYTCNVCQTRCGVERERERVCVCVWGVDRWEDLLKAGESQAPMRMVRGRLNPRTHTHTLTHKHTHVSLFRSAKAFSKQAYDHGVVLVRCPGESKEIYANTLKNACENATERSQVERPTPKAVRARQPESDASIHVTHTQQPRMPQTIGCDNLHLIADRLGWFKDESWDVRKLLEEKVGWWRGWRWMPRNS